MRKKLLTGLLKSINLKKPIPINRRKLIITLTLSSMLFCVPIATSKLQTFNTNLINGKEMTTIANQLNADTAYMGDNTRFIAPKSAPIYVNIAIDQLTDDQMSAMYDAVNQMHTICNTINPKYALEIRFDPTQKELNDLYTINVFKSTLTDDKLGTSQSTLQLPTATGKGTYKSAIHIHDDLFKNSLTQEEYNKLKNTLLHELAHSMVDLNDAYKIDGYTTPTIMQTADDSQIPFSINDLKIFQAKLAPSSESSTDIQQLYTTILPKQELQEYVNDIKSRVTPELLNNYFQTTKYTNCEIDFHNPGEIHALKHQEAQLPVINADGTETYKTYITTQLYKINNTATKYTRYDLNSQGSQLKEFGFNNAVIDNIVFTAKDQVVAKVGDEVLLISLEKNYETGTSTILIDRYSHISPQQYNEWILRLQHSSDNEFIK